MKEVIVISIKYENPEHPERIMTVSFISRWPPNTSAEFCRSERKFYTFRFPAGMPEPNQVCYFWIIHNRPNPAFPKGKLVQIRIYSEFALPEDFWQPNSNQIKEAISRIAAHSNQESWGCDEFETRLSYILENLLDDNELKKYPRKAEKGIIPMLQLDPEKVNAILFSITRDGKPVETGKNIVYVPNDELKTVNEQRLERYLVQKFADNSFNADVKFIVLAHHEPSEKPDEQAQLSEAISKLANVVDKLK